MKFKININGGILSPSWLHSVLNIAKKSGVKSASFGARQQLLIDVRDERELEIFKSNLNTLGVEAQTDSETFPNILSSYAFEGLFNTEGWLGEGIYQDVLAGFDFRPKYKINICDKDQSHAPFFTGHINFISSDVPHFWFCYIRLPKTNRIERFDRLIYSLDIATFSKLVEEQLAESLLNPNERLNDFDLNDSFTPLFLHSFSSSGVIMRPIEKDLVIPRFVMPYYEGVNLWGSTPWIGIYRRDEQFPINFLMELCDLCKETKIGNLCVTAWRSLIIKGIQSKDRIGWEKLLSKYNINVRHAALELNWQTEDDSPIGFRLKKFLVNRFNRFDVRTFGLLFAIKTRHKSEVFGSVIIRREPLFKIGKFGFDFFGTLGTFDIFYAEDFNPHTRKRKTHQLGVPKWRLAETLYNLSKNYYAELATNYEPLVIDSQKKLNRKTQNANIEKQSTLHQCPSCWTVYDEAVEHTKFDLLSESFECPTCGEAKKDFLKVEKLVY